MIKRIKKSLSIKIFLITFFLLGVACSVTYLCIIKLVPSTYSSFISNNTVHASMLLVDQMSNCNDISECEDVLKKFDKENNVVFWLEDKDGNIVYPKETDVEIIVGTFVSPSDESNIAVPVPSDEKSTKYYSVTLKNGDSYTLAIQVDLLIVQQATKVLWLIFPYIILMIFLLSFLCSFLYAKYITHPIVQLNLISSQMAKLNFLGKCNENREDELGDLAKNLNSLSMSLSTALSELQTTNKQLKTEIDKEHELERQRIDFFSAASHELKTPLTILKGHLTGLESKKFVPLRSQ